MKKKVFMLTVLLCIVVAVLFTQSRTAMPQEQSSSVEPRRASDAATLMMNALDENFDYDYAGMYYGSNFDDAAGESGELVILLVREQRTEKVENKYRDLCGAYEKILFVDAEYSYNYLTALQDEARTIRQNHGFPVTGFGVNVLQNKLEINIMPDELDILSEFIANDPFWSKQPVILVPKGSVVLQ